MPTISQINQRLSNFIASLSNRIATLVVDFNNGVVGILSPANGGTGIDNSTHTLTVGGNSSINGTFSGTSSGTNTGNQTISLSGDGSGSGTGAITLTLATVNANVGTFNNITVNAKGLATAASNVAYLTANQNITISGDASGSGTTGIAITLTNNAVTLGKLAQIGNNTLLTNISGSTANVSTASLSSYIDAVMGNAQGSILYRDSAIWARLTPGTAGQFLKTQGASANPVWASQGVQASVSAYNSVSTTLAASAFTKVDLQTENFDNGGYFASSRFTPLVAGIYSVSWSVAITNPALLTLYFSSLYKNGAAYRYGWLGEITVTGNFASVGSCLVSMNGSTDYLELFFFNSHATNSAASNASNLLTFMDAHYAGPT